MTYFYNIPVTHHSSTCLVSLCYPVLNISIVVLYGEFNEFDIGYCLIKVKVKFFSICVIKHNLLILFKFSKGMFFIPVGLYLRYGTCKSSDISVNY